MNNESNTICQGPILAEMHNHPNAKHQFISEDCTNPGELAVSIKSEAVDLHYLLCRDCHKKLIVVVHGNATEQYQTNVHQRASGRIEYE